MVTTNLSIIMLCYLLSIILFDREVTFSGFICNAQQRQPKPIDKVSGMGLVWFSLMVVGKIEKYCSVINSPEL